MKRFDEMLKNNLYGVMATVEQDRPQTRVFQYLFMVEGKVYFGTTNNKPVYEQMKNNPYVSYCTYGTDFEPVLSVNGRAVFEDNREVKERAMQEYPAIKDLYHSPDNPIVEVFYIDVDEVVTFDFQKGKEIIKIK